MNINELWKSIIDYGYSVRKITIQTNNDFNIGQKAWQLLKDNFANYQFEINNIKYDKLDCKNTLVVEYMKKDDDEDHEEVKIKIDDIILDNKIETEHFFIQHYRIPITSNNKLSVQKLMQIAYNIGQFRANRENNIYIIKIIEYYDDNNLDKLETYIINSETTKIIKKQQTGGMNKLYKLTYLIK